MIVLENVSKIYWTNTGSKLVLDRVSHVFQRGSRSGILGGPGSGKSTLIRLLAGIDHPTAGKVRRDVRVSWPLAFVGVLHPRLSVKENIMFAARIYGEDPGQVVRFVEAFAGLEDKLDAPFAELSRSQKAGLSVGLSLAIRFDVYLVDELAVGGELRIRQHYRAEIERRLQDCDVIVASQKPEVLRKFCQDALVLHKGRLFGFSQLEDAVDAYRQIVNSVD